MKKNYLKFIESGSESKHPYFFFNSEISTLYNFFKSYKDLPIRQKFHLTPASKEKTSESLISEDHDLILNIVSRDDILNRYNVLN